MKVKIITGGWARRYIADGATELTLPYGATVADALAALPVPPGETGIVTVGGKQVKENFRLSEGDNLKLYPVIIGG